jgi:hypothetical protein
MSAGILRSWYLAKLKKSKNPIDYVLAMQSLMLYEITTINHNLRNYFN